MRGLIIVLLVSVALALCQASVRRAASCVTAANCDTGVPCPDSAHHWACIHTLCECHSHDTPTTPSPNRPHVGTACTLGHECHGMDHCDSDNEHCFDGKCACYHEHHHTG